MNIYVYSDESGVFDKEHNEIFVFGGLIILGSNSKEEWSRRYSSAEKAIRKKEYKQRSYELKATNISNTNKAKLYRSLNNCYKFGVVIYQRDLLDRIFESKKDKQRYLDYAYKIAVKRAFKCMMDNRIIKASDVERVYFFIDEHTTATNGCYELQEALEQEFKNGTYNFNYSVYYKPIFDNLKEVRVEFCDSSSKLLVRAADIVANKIYYISKNNKAFQENKLNIIEMPSDKSIVTY